ncbi:MAG: hypothetical protein JW849_11800 [Phycisphaerae bacterium]|nr:hypothetical protein [Phycisphaerae bacterium]
MAKKPEDKPPDQAWMLTFSDCMTLLLCFFVLLLSFSSFDEVKFDTLSGAFQSMSLDWLEDDTQRPKLSIIEHRNPKDFPRHGPVVPTHKKQHDKPNQPPIDVMDMDLYKDRTVFYLPSPRFFWGRGVSMTSEGRDYLHSLARLLHGLPCRVVIAESGDGKTADLGLRRSWAVLRRLVEVEDLDPNRFTITTPRGDDRRFRGKQVLEISLMNVQVEE